MGESQLLQFLRCLIALLDRVQITFTDRYGGNDLEQSKLP